MASRFTLQSGGGVIDLQSGGGDLLLQSDVGADAPFKQNLTLENPVRPKRLGGFTELGVNLLVTTLAVTAVYTPRDPLYTQQNKRPVPQHMEHVNLLQTTLAPTATQAFVVPDWYIPRQVRVLQVEQPQNLLTTTLQPAAVETPFVPVDWVTPRALRWSQTEQPQNLLTTTLAPAAPVEKPFTVPDWHLPRSVYRLQTEQPVNLSTSTLAPAESVIVLRQPLFANQNKWPAYRQVEQYQNRLPLLGGVAETPITPVIWNNPVRKAWVGYQPIFTTPVYVTAAPFAPTLWENPKLSAWHKFRGQTEQQSNTLVTTLTPPVAPSVLITVWYNHGVEEKKYTGVSFTPDTGVARKVE